jgi:phosphate transport system protein
LAETVIKEDAAIDAFEVQIEQQCVDLLEKYHPVGSELRFLISALKINDTLERMGDLAENIADTVVAVSKSEDFVRIGDFHEMADRTKKMLTNCLRCFVDGDVKLAYQVIDDDAGVDALQDNILKRIQRELDGPGMSARILLHMEYVARQLERISDLTTNVAEDVIYMIDGKIVRHPSRFKNPTGTFAVGSAVYRRMS